MDRNRSYWNDLVCDSDIGTWKEAEEVSLQKTGVEVLIHYISIDVRNSWDKIVNGKKYTLIHILVEC